MVKVKICGITNADDAISAVHFGADALGFIFYQGSPRHISPDSARDIIRKLPPFITTVGVFVDEDGKEVQRIVTHASLDVVQLHGHEPPEACRMHGRVIKAIRVRDSGDLHALSHYHVSAFLLDAHVPGFMGGSGETFNWDSAVDAKHYGTIILAGGLTPDNVQTAIQRVMPYAVDVSSGVEAVKGKKDHGKMRLFIERVKGFE
jgi:phosphoribosylanthranilate isomerase